MLVRHNMTCLELLMLRSRTCGRVLVRHDLSRVAYVTLSYVRAHAGCWCVWLAIAHDEIFPVAIPCLLQC